MVLSTRAAWLMLVPILRTWVRAAMSSVRAARHGSGLGDSSPWAAASAASATYPLVVSPASCAARATVSYSIPE